MSFFQTIIGILIWVVVFCAGILPWPIWVPAIAVPAMLFNDRGLYALQLRAIRDAGHQPSLIFYLMITITMVIQLYAIYGIGYLIGYLAS